MEAFELKETEIVKGVPVIVFTGYLAKDGGLKLREVMEKLLRAGKLGIVIDLSRCSVISSPGIAILTDLVMQVHDDYKGRCVLAGLDDSKIVFLKMTGIIPLAELAPNAKIASESLKG